MMIVAKESPGGQAPPTWLLPDHVYARFCELVERSAGLHLGPNRRMLLQARLARRMRELELERLGDYYERVVADASGGELVRLLEALCTHETRFFREVRQFELLEQRLCPDWQAAVGAGRRPRRVRVWSAGCSTGEEPYSLAMSLAWHLPAAEGWTLEVLATDLSTRVLALAQEGEWPLRRAEEIPERYLKRFMLRGTGPWEGRMRADDEVRAILHFAQLNLNDAIWPLGAPFDVIFCRNVLIYFGRETRQRVVEQLLGHLAPGGSLVLGHAETLAGLVPHVRAVAPNVYQLAPGRVHGRA